MFLFTEWCLSRDYNTEFESLPVAVLSSRLRQFYGEVRKRDGTPYSKNALAGLRSAIHRHITGAPWHRKINIMQGADFKAANNVLLGVLKEQKRNGLDQTKSFKPITQPDMQKLMESEVFGDSSPQSLQDLVWFSIQFYLCRRGYEGSRQLQKTSFQFHEGDDGEFCTLKYHEASKNHPGGFRDTNDPQRRLHATGGPLCPVAALKLYISKLHDGCQSFYQRPNPNYSEDGSWYLPFPLGIRRLQNMMSRLSQNAGLSCRYTNHCVRAACVTTLMNSGYDPITVTRLSGHRNVASVMSYCRDTTDDTKRRMGESLTSALKGQSQPALASPPRSSITSGVLQQIRRPPPSATLEMEDGNISVSSSSGSNAVASLFSNCNFTIGSFQINNKDGPN